MEEQKPIDFDTSPQDEGEKPKRWHTILYVTVALMALAKLCIDNWDTFRHPVGEYYCRKANKIYNDPDEKDAVLALCDKAISADEKYWKPWYMKGGLYACNGEHYDSACIFLRKALDLHKSDRLAQGNGMESYSTFMLIRCLRKEKRWPEAIELAREAIKIYIYGEDATAIKEELVICYKEYADFLLVNSDDDVTMWKLSVTIWNIDRKRALNLRRKCVYLGNPEAREWYRNLRYN